jgi:hypothetical protein
VRNEVQYFADKFTLPVTIAVSFSDCDGDKNAYYYAGDAKIVFCREYAADLYDLAQSQP